MNRHTPRQPNPTAPMLRFLIFIGSFAYAITTGHSAELFFEKDIRPILKTHCFHCHGEEGITEGNLDLRLKRLIAKGGESGSAISQQDVAESLLLQRIESGEMPPGDKTLSADSIQLIRQWIAQGARTARAEPESVDDKNLFTEEERNHWAFRPLTRPAVPVVTEKTLMKNPIDAFVLSRLESNGLSLSKSTERQELIRRLTFDLTGLPPSPDELSEFCNDRSPTATAKLIERLLASPHYGERWGRHWLDVAGYADSEGYSEEDRVRSDAYRYRDYVIASINRDKPWDQFIREQLAGDEMIDRPFSNLSEDEIEKLTATGFLRMAPDGTASGGIDQNLARNQTIADTIDIVSTSLLGMTVACAQCHNHRYDPISQIDYYRMRAIFEPAFDWKRWRNPIARRISLATDGERQMKQQLEAEIAAVEVEKKKKTDFFINLTLEEELEKLDEALRRPLRDAYRTATTKRTKEQKELLASHPSVQNISPGSLYLYDNKRLAEAAKVDAARKEKTKQFITQIREQALDALAEDERNAVLAAEKIAASGRSPEQVQLLQRHAAVLVNESTLGRFSADAAQELQLDQQTANRLRSTKSVDSLKEFTDQIAAIRAKMPTEGFVRALTEQPGQIPETFVFYRGDHEQPKQKVAPGELTILEGEMFSIPNESDSAATSGRRLAYANHLTDGRHPLVARVIVNRIWLHHFGQGIVASPGDFGVLGDGPTHPELLDWLACEFVDNGWSLKQLSRLIVNSQTYQQSSLRTEVLNQVDPDNQLLGRFPIRRLESEVYRDAVLAVSGRLSRTFYGPAIPVKEDEVGQIVLGAEKLDGERKPVKGDDLGEQAARRSVYVQVRRSRPLGVLETFDRPVMSPNCTKRNVSNVAPQPLMMMNSDFAIDHSAILAERLRREAGDDPVAQIELLWWLTQGAAPSDDELSSAMKYLKTQSELLQPGQDALSTLCHALISTNRFLYVE